MHDYPVAYTQDNLAQILNANDSCQNFADDEVRRLVDLAQRRAQARADSALDDGEVDCIIATEWSGFTQDKGFGFDNGQRNGVAMGVYTDESDAATLFEDTVVVQQGWLSTGDGRRSKVEEFQDESWDDATTGTFWVPNGAQPYLCIVALSNELVHGTTKVADAM